MPFLTQGKANRKFIAVVVVLTVVVGIGIWGYLQQKAIKDGVEIEKGSLPGGGLLLLRGTIYKDERANFDNLTFLPDRTVNPMNLPLDFGERGDYSIALLNKDGGILEEFNFTVSFHYLIDIDGTLVPEETDEMPFLFEISPKEGTSEIQIRYFDKILASHIIDKNTQL